MEGAFGERVKYIATLDRTYRMEKSNLETAIVELQRQFEDLRTRFAQAKDQASQMSR